MSFRSVFKDSIVILLGILLILGLFIFQSYMEHVNQQIKQHNAVTGHQIIIDSGGANDNATNITTLTSQPRKLITDPQILCLMQGGVTEDDVEISGALLKSFPCPVPKKESTVRVGIEQNCLAIHQGQELDTFMCIEDRGVVSLKLALPSPSGGIPPAVFEQKNYNGWFLFFLLLFCLIWAWRQFELRERKLEERQQEKMSPQEHIEVQMIKSAPLFKDTVSEEERFLTAEEARKIHEQLMREQKLTIHVEPMKAEEISESIKTFNILGKDISQYLREGKLNKARKRYLLLFPLYTRLYYVVDEIRKRELVDVMKYLHDQLNIMEKSRKIRHLIEEAYQQVDKHRVDKNPRETEEMVVLKDEKEAKKAAELFSQLGGEREENKQLRKEHVLDQIQKMKEKTEEATLPESTLRDLHEELRSLHDLVYGSTTKKKEKKA